MAKEKKTNWNVWKVIGIVLLVIIGIQLLVSLGSFLFNFEGPRGSVPVVAVVPIYGAIVTDSTPSIFGTDEASSRRLMQVIDEIERDRNVDAVIFHINSPGGFVVPSHKVAQAIANMEKPNVALIEDLGASGAYWVASSSDYIVADDFSMVGSIGVIASYLNFEGLIERFNISYERLVSTELKDMGTPFKELTEEEREVFQNMLDTLHNSFVEAVAVNRGFDEEQAIAVSNGRVFLGLEALELGLVDELGGRREADEYLKQHFNATRLSFVSYARQPGFLAQLFGVQSSLPELDARTVPQFR